MDLVTPDIGLIFWTTVSFAILYFILAKFAWKPILGASNIIIMWIQKLDLKVVAWHVVIILLVLPTLLEWCNLRQAFSRQTEVL